MSGHWTDQAACKGRTQEFFPKSPGRGNTPKAWAAFRSQINEAIATCEACPVLDACKTYAQEASLGHGVWAGEYLGHDFRQGVRTKPEARPAHQCPGCGKPTRAAMCKACRYPTRIATCVVCSTTFKARPGRAGTYCSRDCYRTTNWGNDAIVPKEAAQ